MSDGYMKISGDIIMPRYIYSDGYMKISGDIIMPGYCQAPVQVHTIP